MTKQEILQSLREMQETADRALVHFDSVGKRVSMESVPEVRECIRSLREKLRAEHTRINGVADNDKLTRPETLIYRQAIAGALHTGQMSKIRLNTIPNRVWFWALMDVSGHLGSCSRQLRNLTE